MQYFAVAFLIVLLVDFSPASASPLLIAVEDAAGPWSNRNGTGYANDVVIEAFRAAGVEVKLKVVPYARCKNLVISGDVVACFSMSPERGLDEYVRLSDLPLFVVQFDYFQNRKRPLKIKREIDMQKGTIVGIVIDYEYPASAMKLREQGVTFQMARDEETNLKKLALGRIDAAIINHNEIKPISAILENAGVKGDVEFLLRSATMGSFIGFSRRNPQGEFARRKFNQGFRAIRGNGTLARIASRWDPARRSKADQ